MTDNEIISIDEAIEHCYEVANRKCDDCGKEHLQLAKWLEELKESRETINRQKAEIERLRKQLKEGIDLSDSVVKIFKVEAIKEFAERLCEGRVSNDPVVIAVKAELKTRWTENG